jgi:iron complex transport system substrate-binding protein
MWALAALLVFMIAPGAIAGYPLTVDDASGKQVLVKAKPVRIISLAPSITEILYALGLEHRIVGVTGFCDYPPQAGKKSKIGDMRTSAEAVIALKPDLVIGHALVNDTVTSRLRRLGKTVFAVDPKTIAQVERDILTIGKITARPKSAEKVVREMRASLAAAKASRAGKKRKSVLVLIQASPLWVAGPGTFVHEMIGMAGATNVAGDARAGFVPFSRERAITRKPEVIIVGSKSERDYVMKSAAWKGTPAVHEGKVFVVLPDILVRPGPRLADGLRELRTCLDK